MGYIFTEYFFEFLNKVNDLVVVGESILSGFLFTISIFVPYIIKYLIGYCHFYYQLGYGLIFYIYLFRRHRAKKTKNWTTFYGNSTLNWIIFNITVFNKFLFSRNYAIFLKSELVKFWLVIKFITSRGIYDFKNVKQVKLFYNDLSKKNKFYIWTPLFKRSSYITFLSMLKRFTKRK